MQQLYTNSKLYTIAGENYRVLLKFCRLLDEEGYWKKPAALLERDIQDILDIYVQSVLIRLAVHCKRMNLEERRFIAAVASQNLMGVTQDDGPLEQAVSDAERMLKSPPILIQLCGLRDKEKQTGITGLFFDALMNIILAMAYLNNQQNAAVFEYIKLYFRSVEAFLYDSKMTCALVDEKYIFRKICNGELETSGKHLAEVDDDFELYKKRYLFYKDEAGMGLEEPTVLVQGNEAEAENISVQIDCMTDEKTMECKEQTQDDALHEKLEQLMGELNDLVGLQGVKEEINSLINLIKVRKLRERYALPDMEMSYHMVFTGNPGTGKTTVARLVAAIYKEIGLLSIGNLVETDRSGLVAGYVGQTALKVRETVEKAIGGVLFIDEAYALTSSGAGNDFGKEALETLVKLMEDNRDDLVVIVAGYTEEMKQFLKANTGLVSRFNRFIEFPDYDQEELVDIFMTMSDKAGFWVEEAALNRLKDYLAGMEDQTKESFGNARGIRNLFERVVVNQANRIVEYKEPTIQQLSTILAEDMRVG